MHSPGLQPQPAKSGQDARFGVLLTIFCLLIYAEIYFYSAFGPEFPLYYYWGVGESFQQLLQSYGYFQLGWYRPTASVPYWLLQPILDWHNLAGWRFASVLTCAASGYLVYRIALDLFPGNRVAAMVASLYFVTHPDFYLANFEVAGFDFLHIIFSLLAILLYRRSIYAQRWSAPLAIAAWLCVACGLTAKEVVIAVPGVLVLLSAIRVWERSGARGRAIAVELLRLSPVLVVIPGYWYLHGRHIPKPSGPNNPYHLDFQAGRTVSTFLHLLLWGARIFFVVGLVSADVYPGTWLDNLAGLLVLALVVWRWSKRKEDTPQLVMLIGWYLLLLVVPAITAGFMRHTSLSVPAYSILVGVAVSDAIALLPQARRKQIAWAGGVALSLLTVWNIHREINNGTHSLPIRVSQGLIAKPPIAPEALGAAPQIYIEDRLGLGAWAYGCYGNLFNFVYKRKDVTEKIVAPGEDPPDIAHLPGNVHYFRYNDRFEWTDATDELRAASVTPAVADTEPGRPVQLNTGLRRFGKLAWSLIPAGAGTISDNGEYVPPERVPAPMLVRVTAATSVQPQKRATAEIHVFPKWQDTGIGGARGWHKIEGATHTLSGDGEIGGRRDRFRFAYQKIASDGSMTAMVAMRSNAEAPWKAGVVIRTSLKDDAPFLFLGTQAGRPTAVWRDVPGAATQMDYLELLPFSCFRVDRIGDQLSGSTSSDCEHWTSLGPILRVSAGVEVFAGLAIASGNGPATNADFVNVRWQSGANPK